MARAVSTSDRPYRGASSARAARRTSPTRPTSDTSPAPTSTDPCRFAQSATRGSVRKIRRPGFLTSEAAKARTITKSGNASACARSCQDHGATSMAKIATIKRAPGRRSALAGDCDAESERDRHEGDVQQHSEAHSADPVNRVEDDLRQPLLIGPAVSEGHHGQRLTRRQSVVGDLAPGDERHPAVGDEELRRDRQENRAEQRDDDDEQAVLRDHVREVCDDGWLAHGQAFGWSGHNAGLDRLCAARSTAVWEPRTNPVW